MMEPEGQIEVTSRHCHHQQGQQYPQEDSVVKYKKNVDQENEDKNGNGTLRPCVGSLNNLGGDSDEQEVIVIDSDDETIPQSVGRATSELQRNQSIPDVDGDEASEAVIDDDDSSESVVEDGNESDVVDLFEDDEDMFQKVNSQERMICNRCYPITHFRKKSLYIIHRLRHYAETHYICPICRKGFVKLSHCVNHELSVHKAETKLTDQRFSTALSVIVSDKSVEASNLTNVIETQETENDDLYLNYPVVSSVVYPYKGPEISSFAVTYQMQYKYGRPRCSNINNIAKLANQWKNDAAEFERRELAYEAQQRKKTESKSAVRAVSTASKFTKSDEDGRDDDLSNEKEVTTKKKKIYKKKVRRRSNSPERSYCCKICNFKCDSNDKFQDHKTTSHPNLTEAEVLQYFVLPTIGRYSPVRKKKTAIGTFLSNSVEQEGSGYSSSSSLANSSISTPPSIILHDLNSKVGFANALDLLQI